MHIPKHLFLCGSLCIALLFSSGGAYAFDDGLGSARKIEGKNVILYLPPDTSANDLMAQLGMTSADAILAGKGISKASSPDEELIAMLDALYMQVSDITDMHLYSLQVSVKVCHDQSQLESIYNSLFNADLKGRYSFYVSSFNTIYVSAGHFVPGVIGHEIGHAIITHYFVVQPPVKIQEVLAMYVEYNLKKGQR
jgi:hypothetical protein